MPDVHAITDYTFESPGQIVPLRKLIEFVAHAIEGPFAKRGGIGKLYFVVSGDGHYHMLPFPEFGDADESAAAARAMMHKLDATAYVHADEAWTIDSTSAAELNAAIERGLEHHPHRREVVILSGEDRERFMMAQRDIIRSAISDKPVLGPLRFVTEGESGERDQWEGRLIGLLPRKGRAQ